MRQNPKPPSTSMIEKALDELHRMHIPNLTVQQAGENREETDNVEAEKKKDTKDERKSKKKDDSTRKKESVKKT